MEVLYLTFEVELEAPLLLDPESVFLEQQACQDGLARLHQGIFEFGQRVIYCLIYAPLT